MLLAKGSRWFLLGYQLAIPFGPSPALSDTFALLHSTPRISSDTAMSDDGSAAGSPPHSHHEKEIEDQSKELSDQDVAAADDSDKDSDILSEIDEDQFDDYDPTAARIEEKPVEIDEDVARTLKAGRRKGQAVRKPKEGRRAKKRRDQDDNDGADGEILTSKRVRRPTAPASKKATPEPEAEENLTPEERRRRAIERAASKEVKKAVNRRKRKDEDVGLCLSA